LIRADRVISLLIPFAAGCGAGSPDDQALHRSVCAEVEGGTGGESMTRVKLADCGRTPAAELLAGLAVALGSAVADSEEGCVFVLAGQDQAGSTRWFTARQLPAAWPQSTAPAGGRVALTRSSLAVRGGTVAPSRLLAPASEIPLLTTPRAGRVRFWKRNGSGDPPPPAVKRGQTP